jgi:predicted  nucleic acid-binding Zn-ribbon protein
MSDLTERLRSTQNPGLAVRQQAADEIESLRSRVAELEAERELIVARAENAEAALAETESDRDAAFRAHDKAHAACIHYDEMLTVARELLGEAREALRGWSRDDGTTEGDCPCSMCNNTRLNNRIDAHLAGDA